MRLQDDYDYHFFGWYDAADAVCRVRVFVPHDPCADDRSVLIIEEKRENDNTSIDNMMPYLAAELVQRHALARPVIIDHFPWSSRSEESWSVADFEEYEPCLGYDPGGHRRPQLRGLTFKPATRAGVEALVGRALGHAEED